MSYAVLTGLLVLIGLLPQTFFNPTLPTVSFAQTSSPATSSADPEQLFGEALQIAETGNRAEAVKRLDEACSIWIKRRESERAARARVQIGDIYRSNKSFEESLSQYQKTLLIANLPKSLRAAIYDAIGQIYGELYRADLALPNYSQALNLARTTKDYALEAQVQLNIAALSNQSGEFRRAMDLAKSAISASTQGRDDKTLARSLGFLAQMEFKLGLVDQGRRDLERAYSLYKQNNDVPAQIRTLCFLSAFNLANKQFDLAKDQATTALKLVDDVAQNAKTYPQRLLVNSLRWPCWLALARVQRATNKLGEALNSYFRASTGTVVSWWVVYASTEKSAISFAEERQALYRELVDLLIQMGKIDEAYYAYQQARVRTLTGLIRARQPVSDSSHSDTTNSSNQLSRAAVTLRKRLLSPTLTKLQREALQKELADVEAEQAEKQFKFELAHFRHRLVFSNPVDLKRLQSVLRDDEAVIEFNLGQERSFVWLITPESSRVEELPRRAEIEEKVRQYVTLLATAPSNLHLQSSLARQRELGAELFTTLLGKLNDKLGTGTKLIVIPDGVLNRVPYEALVQNDKYLIEDHEISYVPSASLIELLRQQPPPASTQMGQLDLLAFGDPDFRNKSKPATTRKSFTMTSGTTDGVWGDDVSKLSPLPRTRDEVEFIASLIPVNRKRLYLGKECTEKAFKQESLNKYRWIHLATHSLIDERDPDRSAVVLPVDGNDNEDGLLRVPEIAELNLQSDLVILSACDTGRGQVFLGEGIIGLSRSFFIAGARSLVVSQWAVSDISTAQFMKDFYQQLVTDVAKPAALREAKLRMLRSTSETRHPYYWAPFILIGAP